MNTFPTTYEVTNKAQFARAMFEPLETTRLGNSFVFNTYRVERMEGEDNRFRVFCYDVAEETEVTLYVEVMDT